MAWLARGMVVSALLALSSFGCGDDDGGGNGGGAGASASGDEQSATLGSEGGELAIDGASVEVPEGALAEDVELSVERLSGSSAAPHLAHLDDGLEAASDVLVLTPHGSQFEEAVSVTLAYRGDAEGLIVKRLDDEDDESWETVAGAQFAGGEASFETTRFSLIVVAREGPVPAIDGGAVPSDAGTEPPPAAMDAGEPQQQGGSGAGVDGDFEIRVDELFEVSQGSTASLNVVAMRAAGFDDPIDVTVDGLPDGVTAEDSVIVGADNGTLVAITAEPSAAPGTTEVTVHASAGTTERTATVSLVVVGPPQSVLIGVTPYAFTITRGGSTEVSVTLTPGNGFEGTVELSFAEITPLEGVTFEPTSIDCEGTEPTTQTVTFSASDDAEVGLHNINFETHSDAESNAAIGLGITIE